MCGPVPIGEKCKIEKADIHDWIDSDTCPALVPALIELSEIRIPPVAGTTGLSDFYASHQTDLTIEGMPQPSPGGYARLPRNSALQRVSITEQHGYFRNWWTRTDAALKPCWTQTMPVFRDDEIAPHLRR